MHESYVLTAVIYSKMLMLQPKCKGYYQTNKHSDSLVPWYCIHWKDISNFCNRILEELVFKCTCSFKHGYDLYRSHFRVVSILFSFSVAFYCDAYSAW